MSHFAQIENNVVTQVIVAEQDIIDTGVLGDPSNWIQTSYNTYGGIHYGQDGNPDGGVALRGNYAGIGFIYDSVNDVFYEPQPYPSWVIFAPTWIWQAPVPYPVVDNPTTSKYVWDESIVNWVLSQFQS